MLKYFLITKGETMYVTNWIYLVTIVAMGMGTLYLDSRKIAPNLTHPAVWIIVLIGLSVLATSLAETFVAKYMSPRVLLICLFASVTLYSGALYINNFASANPIISIVLIAMGWNLGNTVLTTIFGLILDPRLFSLPTSGKIALAFVIFSAIGAGLAGKHVMNLLENPNP